MPARHPREENRPFAFRGEKLSPKRLLRETEARLALDGRNPTRKPNADVIRESVGVDAARNVRRRWMLDFPSGISAAEAALYVEPFRLLRERGLRPENPDRGQELRNALARVDRFLATPMAGPLPAFAWLEAEALPDDSLLVWARDDDFSFGVLSSRCFGLWWKTTTPLTALESFLFPWPPGTPISSLSREQEDHRHAIARAARAEDDAAINEAVLRAYGLAFDATDDEILSRLRLP